MSELEPDGYLVLGDTNSCLSAISAKRLHIPLFHMEAGNRCKDECLPEETNRRIVDVISDVNLCYSEFARKYLADTGHVAEVFQEKPHGVLPQGVPVLERRFGDDAALYIIFKGQFEPCMEWRKGRDD